MTTEKLLMQRYKNMKVMYGDKNGKIKFLKLLMILVIKVNITEELKA